MKELQNENSYLQAAGSNRGSEQRKSVSVAFTCRDCLFSPV